jgi:hypothetical protein
VDIGKLGKSSKIWKKHQNWENQAKSGKNTKIHENQAFLVILVILKSQEKS